MTTEYIKTTLIERLKKMNSRDAKKVYGLMIEYNLTDSFFSSFNDIPAEHKLALRKGINDFKNGKSHNAKEFVKKMKNKYA